MWTQRNIFKVLRPNPSLRRDGDSNPGYAFDVYTLSRRASSATRASLHYDVSGHNLPVKPLIGVQVTKKK